LRTAFLTLEGAMNTLKDFANRQNLALFDYGRLFLFCKALLIFE
jgi:hypothetical protein